MFEEIENFCKGKKDVKIEIAENINNEFGALIITFNVCGHQTKH